MLDLLDEYSGKLSINGQEYENVLEAEKFLSCYNGGLTIVLTPDTPASNISSEEGSFFRVCVKRYMTNYKEDFFLSKLNSEGPMPYMRMIAHKLEETPKLVKAECFLDCFYDDSYQETRCMRCGRLLSNMASQYIGIGPECGGEEYIKMIESGISVKDVQSILYNKYKKIKWTGWIVKSAIESAEEVKGFKI